MSCIQINIFDRDRSGGFVPFSSGFGPTHLISLLDVQVPMQMLENTDLQAKLKTQTQNLIPQNFVQLRTSQAFDPGAIRISCISYRCHVASLI